MQSPPGVVVVIVVVAVVVVVPVVVVIFVVVIDVVVVDVMVGLGDGEGLSSLRKTETSPQASNPEGSHNALFQHLPFDRS